MANYLESLEKEHEGKIETTDSGLRYIVINEGKGDKPSKGTQIMAHYSGKLVNGKKFDSSYDRKEPFSFRVGIGEVIPGWDEAFLDMTSGEKRVLIIPPSLGYGNEEIGPIPAGSTLVFEAELVGF